MLWWIVRVAIITSHTAQYDDVKTPDPQAALRGLRQAAQTIQKKSNFMSDKNNKVNLQYKKNGGLTIMQCVFTISPYNSCNTLQFHTPTQYAEHTPDRTLIFTRNCGTIMCIAVSHSASPEAIARDTGTLQVTRAQWLPEKKTRKEEISGQSFTVPHTLQQELTVNNDNALHRSERRKV